MDLNKTAMTALQKVEALRSEFTPGKRAMLIQKVAGGDAHAFPGVEKTSGVCGGGVVKERVQNKVTKLSRLFFDLARREEGA